MSFRFARDTRSAVHASPPNRVLVSKVMIRWLPVFLIVAALVCAARAQPPAPPLPADARIPPVGVQAPVEALEAQIDGLVINDLTGQPLRRAFVTLRPLEAGLTATGTQTDEQGHFLLRKVVPGNYSLAAQCDHYLATATFLRSGLRMPQSFSIAAGDQINDVTFRLRPWAVMSGKVRFDDAEFAVGARVEMFRAYRSRGRRTYQSVGGTLTDDRGEYRIYGLQPGEYFLAASYDRALTPGFKEQPRTDAQGRELPALGFAMTFFPHTTVLSEAVPIRLEYGAERAGVDLVLGLEPKVKITGTVTSAATGLKISSGALILSRADDGNRASIATGAKFAFIKDRFEIPDVVPGSYLLRAEMTEGGKSLSGQTLILVTNQDANNVDVIVSAPQPWTGVIRFLGDAAFPGGKQPRVTLEPRSDNRPVAQATVHNTNTGMELETAVMTDDVYDVYVDNLPDDYYLSAVKAANFDVRATGLAGNQASTGPFEIFLDPRGGQVLGRVFSPDVVNSEKAVWSGANLVLIPDPPDARLQDYRSVGADQYGQFQFRGVAPGKYTLIAWLDEPPCDYYDPGALDACRATGMPITVDPQSSQNFDFNVKPLPGR
jgi:Carboxypeptidase regulatory-like domain